VKGYEAESLLAGASATTGRKTRIMAELFKKKSFEKQVCLRPQRFFLMLAVPE
jgi:hypothetical protein